MYNFGAMLLFEVCTPNSQKMKSFNSSNFKVLKYTNIAENQKKIKNLNAFDIYLSRKKNQKVHFS